MPHNSSVRHVEIVLGFIVDWKYPGMISIILPENITLGWVLPPRSYADLDYSSWKRYAWLSTATSVLCWSRLFFLKTLRSAEYRHLGPMLWMLRHVSQLPGASPDPLPLLTHIYTYHDWATSLSLFTFMHWRRKWQPTPVFLPGESQGRGSLVGCRLWGRAESDTTEAT